MTRMRLPALRTLPSKIVRTLSHGRWCADPVPCRERQMPDVRAITLNSRNWLSAIIISPAKPSLKYSFPCRRSGLQKGAQQSTAASSLVMTGEVKADEGAAAKTCLTSNMV